ncbi:DUF1634 domain-containing protein [Mucilaginibacter sp.]|jgi:uncharacterized membrane protein|uniref:DUF1634 domain-containing protein n=1 Tax=Mucilaginibacter sp. TaxID=1882438 RepID=UPI002C5682AB|nr:DUF1634 domain-containing protein [Mucilaginibacter sp.]HTI58193.1 DUF1634 domain-containing protein [Mucilaginibacter sp.]
MASREKFNTGMPAEAGAKITHPPVSPEKSAGFKDKDMQAVIGWILRTGVFVSTAFVITGGIIFLVNHGHSQIDFASFNKVPDFISHIKGVIQGVIHLKGQAIIQFGIVLLIATPVFRVLFAGIGFLIEKDYLYTFISTLVLLIILISMISGHIG